MRNANGAGTTRDRAGALQDGTHRARFYRTTVEVVRYDDEVVLVRPRQDLDVRRGRGADGGPVDSLEPVSHQALDPAWRQVHVHE